MLKPTLQLLVSHIFLLMHLEMVVLTGIASCCLLWQQTHYLNMLPCTGGTMYVESRRDQQCHGAGVFEAQTECYMCRSSSPGASAPIFLVGSIPYVYISGIHLLLWIYYIYSYITYPIIPTQNLCYRVSITLLIFLHILLYHISLLNSKKPFSIY